MLLHLHKLFEEHGRTQRYEMSKSFIRARMFERTPFFCVVENNKKRKKSFKKGQGKSKRTEKAKVAQKKKSAKAKGHYFYCAKDGHWKRNCKTFVAEKAKMKLEEASGLFMIDLCFSVNMDSAWVLDTRCASHICSMCKCKKGIGC